MHVNYRPALELAQRSLRPLGPRLVAERSGADLVETEGGQEFRLKLLAREYRIPMPEAIVYDVAAGIPAGVSATLILLHYLATADGSPPRREWLPFRSIPGGNVYAGAFRAQCIVPLISTFGRDPEALLRASEAIRGVKGSFGDASYFFPVLPQLPMACILWLGDEEQGAEANLLFDAVAPNYLPTEDLAALGRLVAFGLIKAARPMP